MNLESISLTESYRFWNAELRAKRIREMVGFYPSTHAEWSGVVPICPLCKGYGVTQSENGVVYCFCNYLRMREAYAIRALNYESPCPRGVSLTVLDPKKMMSSIGKKDLRDALVLVDYWVRQVDQWIFMTGGPGTGKTTMLYAAKETLGSLAFYITMPNFQDTLFSLKDDSAALADFMDTVKGAPVLLLDDLGLEYGKSPWTTSMVANVINHRYAFGSQLPVFVTSNLKSQDLVQSPDLHVRRIASRLIDGQHTSVVILHGEDFRVKTQQENAA